MPSLLQVAKDDAGIVTVTFDAPGKSVNTCSAAFFEQLDSALAQFELDKPAAVIFTSAKPGNFIAGADLFEIREMNRLEVSRFILEGQNTFERIAHLPCPTVAAINGDCLGGGMELALACRYRVAADDGSISLGLPEVKLGLIPAWGGTTRLPRLIGLARALGILLPGKTMPPRKARKSGLVDEVVRPEALLAAARRLATRAPAPDRPTILQRIGARLPFVRRRILDTARQQTLKTTAGNYPAPMKLIDVVREGYKKGFAGGLSAEHAGILELMDTESTQNLLRLFFLRQGAKKRAAAGLPPVLTELTHAAVIGGGTMGAGIVHAMIRAGISVRLIEVNDEAASKAMGRISALLDEDVAAGKLDRLAAKHALNRVAPSTQWTGLHLADVIVEAVLETMDAKKQVFEKLVRLVRPDAVLATNTSSLSVTDLAQSVIDRTRIVGLHFFNPVPKMPLVEVVRTRFTSDAALATAVALAARIGKTPVRVNDGPGFLVNRILLPYLAEALSAATDGVPIPLIDEAMKKWGMPMGPFELLDEIGLDVILHIVKALGGRFSENPATATPIVTAVEHGWLGKKTGKGFYVHAGDAKKKDLALNEELAVLSAGRTTLPEIPPDEHKRAAQIDAIQWRLVLPMVNEAARALEDRTVDSTDTLDLAMVLGTGLAPFRGGLAQFARAVGIDELKHRMREMMSEHGPRFAPSLALDLLMTTGVPAPRPAPQPAFETVPPGHGPENGQGSKTTPAEHVHPGESAMREEESPRHEHSVGPRTPGNSPHQEN